MKVLFLSAEVEPFAKVGGLADVAGSLPKTLNKLGHESKIVMPGYKMVLEDPRWTPVKVATQIPVQVNSKQIVLADVYSIHHDGVDVWLITGDHFFDNVRKSEEVYSPSREAYLFFSQAALEACRTLAWRPDIVHANDWHTAFASVFLREKFDWPHTASVYTIHNLAYQGEFGADTIEAAGLSPSLFNMHQLETWGGVNFLKAGCVFSDQVNTVSPSYSQEIQTPAYGCRLEGLMKHLSESGRLRGILNGIDTFTHDPSTDPRIPNHFNISDLTGKEACRTALCHELGLPTNPGAPIVGVVSRLSDQKGFDLICECAQTLLGTGIRLVILAIGDPGMAQRLREIEVQHPDHLRFIEAYDASLAQRIYAGADMFLMPSAFEPCGLGQMFAMRYGTVPIVRHTGGLADTVSEGQTGFVFWNKSSTDMLAAVQRAVNAFRSPQWKNLVVAAMTADHSWDKSALDYLRMYDDALRGRKMLEEALEAGIN